MYLGKSRAFQLVEGCELSTFVNSGCTVQGRLIPGTSVASVPFIDEVRSKMLTAWKQEGIPDECFRRLRGALFVGPSWTVTRNKLKLRCASKHIACMARTCTCSGDDLCSSHVQSSCNPAFPWLVAAIDCAGTTSIRCL